MSLHELLKLVRYAEELTHGKRGNASENRSQVLCKYKGVISFTLSKIFDTWQLCTLTL